MERNEIKKTSDSEYDEEGEDSLSEDNHFYVASQRFTLKINSDNDDDDDDNDNDNDIDANDNSDDNNCDAKDHKSNKYNPMTEHSYCMVQQQQQQQQEEEDKESMSSSSLSTVTVMAAKAEVVAAAGDDVSSSSLPSSSSTPQPSSSAAAEAAAAAVNDEDNVTSTTSKSPPYDPTACPSLPNIKLERQLKKKKERVKRQNTRLRSKSPIPRKAITLTVPIAAGAAAASSNRLLTIRNGQDMVRISCNNRSNFDNIELMEWSEAVLLQLCYINEPLDFKLIDWKAVKQIFLYQWRYEVTLPLQEYVGRKETLSNIIIRNHARKVQLGLIPYSEMFTSGIKNRLNINYRLLCEYAAENRRRERICIPNMKLKWH